MSRYFDIFCLKRMTAFPLPFNQLLCIENHRSAVLPLMTESLRHLLGSVSLYSQGYYGY